MISEIFDVRNPIDFNSFESSETNQMAWSFSNLRSLDMNGIPLASSIPHEQLALMTSLERLSIEDSSVTGTIPSGIGLLTSLRKYLVLNRCMLLLIATKFFSGYLGLWLNRITGLLPTELGMLSNLEQLRLTSNVIQGKVPTSLGRLEKIITIHLGDNVMSGSIPDAVCELPDVKRIVYQCETQTCRCEECECYTVQSVDRLIPNA